MVEVDKQYTFHGPNGSALPLEALFGDKEQLIVYHFMFDPDAERGCRGCAFTGSSSTPFHSPPLPPAPTTNPLTHLGIRPYSRAHPGPAPPRLAQHGLLRHLPRPLPQARRLEAKAGLDLPLVLQPRLRLQLRLPRDAGRLHPPGRVQFHPRRGARGQGAGVQHQGRAAGAECFCQEGREGVSYLFGVLEGVG
jgi:hypothetical protein